MRARSAIWTFTLYLATDCLHKRQYNEAKMLNPVKFTLSQGRNYRRIYGKKIISHCL